MKCVLSNEVNEAEDEYPRLMEVEVSGTIILMSSCHEWVIVCPKLGSGQVIGERINRVGKGLSHLRPYNGTVTLSN